MSNKTKFEVAMAPKKVLCAGTLEKNAVFRSNESGNIYVVVEPAQSRGDEVVVHCLVENRSDTSCSGFTYNFSNFIVASKVEVKFD